MKSKHFKVGDRVLLTSAARGEYRSLEETRPRPSMVGGIFRVTGGPVDNTNNNWGGHWYVLEKTWEVNEEDLISASDLTPTRLIEIAKKMLGHTQT